MYHINNYTISKSHGKTKHKRETRVTRKQRKMTEGHPMFYKKFKTKLHNYHETHAKPSTEKITNTILM